MENNSNNRPTVLASFTEARQQILAVRSSGAQVYDVIPPQLRGHLESGPADICKLIAVNTSRASSVGGYAAIALYEGLATHLTHLTLACADAISAVRSSTLVTAEERPAASAVVSILSNLRRHAFALADAYDRQADLIRGDMLRATASAAQRNLDFGLDIINCAGEK